MWTFSFFVGGPGVPLETSNQISYVLPIYPKIYMYICKTIDFLKEPKNVLVWALEGLRAPLEQSKQI